MSTLSRCIKKHRNKIPAQYLTDIETRAQEYRAEGFSAKESNVSAVKDALKDAEQEKQDYENQLKKLKPELFKVA